MSGRSVLAHGAMTSTTDMLVSLGPILLAGLMFIAFGLLLGIDAKRRKVIRPGERDERPTASRLLFSGTYYELERLAQFNWDDDNKYDPAMKTGSKQPATL
jgi:hypothetical protein